MYELSIPCCAEHHFSIQSPVLVIGRVADGVSLKWFLKTGEGEPVRIVFCKSASAPRVEII